MPSNTARREGGDGDARADDSRQLDLEVDGLGVEIIPPGQNLPAEIPIETIENARLPASYKKAITALNRCLRVDEAKEWADRAEAVAAYARMSRDEELLKKAQRIKDRAFQKCGELLKQFDARGGDRKSAEIKKDGTVRSDPSRSDVGRSAGMSERQVKDAVRVANVPRKTFEEMVESDDPPTVTKLAEIGKASKPGRAGDPESSDPSSRPVSLVPRAKTDARAVRWAVLDMIRRIPVGRFTPEEAADLDDPYDISVVEKYFAPAVKWFDEWAQAWRRRHHEQTQVEPPPDLVDSILGHCFTWKQDHPEITDRDVLGALKEACRLVASGVLNPESDEVWEKRGPLDGGLRLLVLTPSSHPGFTYVTVFDNGIGELIGGKRPLRDDAIEERVRRGWSAPMPTKWRYTRSTRHRENPHLIGSVPVLTEEQRSAVFAEPAP